jgi:formamidopyrimidine-DNA glycosylase
MPELPEVETVRRGLARALPGEEIVSVKVLRPQSIEYPTAEQFSKLLPGHKFGEINRRGKYLLLSLDHEAGLAVHLRMSGRLLVTEQRRKPEQHLRVKIKLSGGKELRFEDMRVFGRLWYVPAGKQFHEIIPGLADLGVEPLENLTAAYLKEAFDRKTQAIKSALLDQTIIAGIGNIYADEALFEAGINPLRSAQDLTSPELEQLVDRIRLVLARAIELGGSSIKDYRDASGVNGSYQHEALVYGRTGEPCRRCESTIERVKLVGRSTHFCKLCQPRSRRRQHG